MQPSGLGQYAYSLLCIAVAGVAVERNCGPSRWLAGYLLGGLAGNVAMSLWFRTTSTAGPPMPLRH